MGTWTHIHGGQNLTPKPETLNAEAPNPKPKAVNPHQCGKASANVLKAPSHFSMGRLFQCLGSVLCFGLRVGVAEFSAEGLGFWIYGLGRWVWGGFRV